MATERFEMPKPGEIPPAEVPARVRGWVADIVTLAPQIDMS